MESKIGFVSRLPSLRLSDPDIAQLDQRLSEMIDQSTRGLEQFASEKESIRNSSWKPIKTKHKVTVYKRSCKILDRRLGIVNRPPNTDKRRMPAMFASSTCAQPDKAGIGVKTDLHVNSESMHTNLFKTQKSVSTASEEDGDLSRDNIARPLVQILDSESPCETMACGIIPGTLNDFVFGLHAADEMGWKQNSMYLQNGITDSVLLFKSHGPTISDPFQFVGLKWFLRNLPSISKSLAQHRDFVVLEAVGLKTDANGERYGYYVLQSVDVADVPDFSAHGIHRGRISLAFVAREQRRSKTKDEASQHQPIGVLGPERIQSRTRDDHTTRDTESSGALEIHCLATLDVKGSIVASIALRSLTDLIFSITNASNCAFMKRLACAMHQSAPTSVTQSTCKPVVSLYSVENGHAQSEETYDKQQAQDESKLSSVSTSHDKMHQALGSSCSTCRRSISFWRLHHGIKLCHLCKQVVCSRCNVELKVLTHVTSSTAGYHDNIELVGLQFCLHCIVKVRKLSAWDIALQTIKEHEWLMNSIQFCPY